MPSTVVFDLDKVLLGGDASTARSVLVDAGERAARRVELTLGRRPETVPWR